MRIDRLQLAGYRILVESLGERLKFDEDLVLASKAEEFQEQKRIRAYDSSTCVSQRDTMSALLARTGRHRQRYEDDYRLVAGCIPYRLKENEDNLTGNLEKRLEVLMISSPNRHDLVFPKGGWEDDESKGEAACREALEEAGVRGRLDKNELGVWEFRSKSKQNCRGMEGYCRGYMFALEVTEELEFWPEKSSHERRWLNVEEAFNLCRYEWMRGALKAFLRSLREGYKRRAREDAVAAAVEVAEHSIVGPCFVNASTPSASTNPINALC